MKLKSPFLPLILALAALSGPSLRADEVRLKSGQALNGRITYEGDDMIRIEVPISESIKETKVIARGDIESITKDAPDDVAFNKLQSMVPTGSLLSADNYRRMLETGPDAFLREFPGSKHVEKVKEIRTTLAEELDRVERGHLKVDNDWYTSQDKVAFPELIDSRIRLVRMQNSAKAANLGGYLAAMREYEVIEENYLGSPAFPKAVELAKEVIPNLGRQLQTLAANVDYQNAEYERSLSASTPEAQAQLRGVRDREEKAIADSVSADKKAGVKWTQLSVRNKQAIEDYLKLAASELARIREYDTAALAVQADQLVAVDRLIAEEKIAEAKAKLAEASAMVATPAATATSKSKSKTSSSSKSKGSSKGGGSYIAALNTKINNRIEAAKADQKAKEAASASEALTANLKKTDTPADPAGETPDPEAPAAGETDPAAETPVDFATLAAAKKSPEKAGEETSSSKKSKSKESKSKDSKSKSKKKAASDDEEEGDEDGETPKRRTTAVEDEGGFPFWVIPAVITAIAGIGIAVMKFTGKGGKAE